MGKLEMSLGFGAKSSQSEIFWFRSVLVPITIIGVLFFVIPCSAQSGASADLPSETPTTVTPATSSFDYIKRDVMIPMRDGVRLHTVIVLPKGAKMRRSCSLVLPTTPRPK